MLWITRGIVDCQTVSLKLWLQICYDINMNKSRLRRGRHRKTRHVLLALIGILVISICLLGGFIAFKIYQQKSFEQRLNRSKRER